LVAARRFASYLLALMQIIPLATSVKLNCVGSNWTRGSGL
jgi:hypothetical protein